jgi:hypothetical protein
LIIKAKAEKKQTAALLILTVMAIGLWARGAAQSNSSAQAGQTESTSTASDASASGAAGGERAREFVTVPPTAALSRDLFLPRAEDFARPPQTDPGEALGAKSARDHDEKTPDPESLPRVTLEERVREQAGRLTLRSTVVGTDPIAVIETEASGQTERVVLRMGETGFGFTLRGVRHRTATLEKDGVVVELTIPLH